MIENAICLHEEDYGILWKHVDLFSGRSEVRRSRRLVVNSVATVGNYEYAFCWYLYLDGNIQLEVKLTGIVSPMAIEPGSQPEFANVVAPGVAAPHHQHLFNVRLDFDIDGPDNEIYEIEAEAMPWGDDNPWGNAFAPRATRLGSEVHARRNTNSATSRYWKIVNPHVKNGLGQPVAYKLVPTMSTPTLLAQPDSSVGRRAGFAQHNLWATPYSPDERRAAGEFPNQHEGGDGLPRWTRGGPRSRRYRHRRLVHVRRHALRAPRGLAGHAGRVRRVPDDPDGLLRPQPRPGPPTQLPLPPLRLTPSD